MKRMDRRALFTSGAAAALLAATGVSAEPKRGGRLRVALSRTDLLDEVAEACLHEGLTEIAADGTVRGEIATHWASDRTGHVWHLNLRPTFFHDGQPLTEADLQASLGHLGHIKLIGLDLTISLNTANPNLPYQLAQPQSFVRPADPERTGIATGLYQIRKLAAGRHFIADRVAKHWKDGQAGWFDTVELVHFSDATVRAQALREGLVDLADIDALDPYTDPKAFTLLPDPAHPNHIAAKSIALPNKVGTAFPFDNLRMSERWWFA